MASQDKTYRDLVSDKLIDLASDSEIIYDSANDWLFQQGPQITPELIKGLENEGLGSVCHWRILNLLRSFAAKESFPAVLNSFHRALEHYDPIVLPAAMEVLSVFGLPEATSALIPLIEHHNPDIVKQAAACLGKTGDPMAIPPLETLLESDDPSLRFSATVGLINLKDFKAYAILANHLKRENNSEIRNLIKSKMPL